MRPVLTAAESARLDSESSTPVVDLMRRAGAAAAHVAVTRFGIGYGSKVRVVAGPGNNGGDAYVVASVLARRGAAVEVVAYGEPSTQSARHHARSWPRSVSVPSADADLVVDGLFGVGSRPGLADEAAREFAGSAPILSLDLPSGLEADTGQAGPGTVQADVTVAFHTLKPGHLLGDGPDHCGELVTVDIGLEGGEPAYLLTEATEASRPPRPRRAHKWSAGSVLVVGGSSGMVGAAIIAARSALAFGAGAVGVAVPDPTIAQTAAPEILAFPLTDLPTRFETWVVGPGLGRDHPDLVAHAHRRQDPTVIDADALGPWSAKAAAHENIVLTPHAGELRRMGGGATSATLLRKGSPTVIEGTPPWIVASGGPELATIGTGDVLAGMIGALLARGLRGPEAARSAAFWHGVAGHDLLAREGHLTAHTLARHVGRYAWSGA